MTERLIVEDDEAHTLAQELAERRGVSLAEAVVSSLRESLHAVPGTLFPPRIGIPSLDEMTIEQRADYDALRALVREAAAHIVPGATSDHSYLYDENGLPI